jgi:hypothetical protein
LRGNPASNEQIASMPPEEAPTTMILNFGMEVSGQWKGLSTGCPEGTIENSPAL